MGAAPKAAGSDDTFAKLMRVNAWVRGARPAFRLKEYGVWRTWTWAQAYEETRALAQGLADLGLASGDRIAVAGANRPKLYWAITAAQMLGAIPVPLYADAVADEIAAVLELAGAKFIIAQDQEQVDKMLSILPRLASVERVLYEEPRGLADYDDPRLGALDAALAAGHRRLADAGAARAMDARIDSGKGSDPSVILFTSGTTGRSKGVVLTGERCIAAARDTVAFDNLTDRDEVLAYLPLAWVGDHYLNYAQGYVAGFCMACPESAATAAEDLREIGPSYHFAPPRVFEALLTRVMIRMEDASRLKRWLFRHFMEIAKRWGETILARQPAPLMARFQYALGRLLIYEPLKNTLGFTRIRVAYTAGEAIGADLFAFYRSLGLNLKQLYGQTEAFLYVTAQADGAVRSDTVGPPAPNVELRLSSEGEVQFKSPGMFVGYYQEPDKTAEALTEDGFIKTGDAGLFEPDGQLKIVDRAKDVGRLSNGQLFAPKYIENKLKFFADIREAVAIGDGREFVTVMLNIELASVGNWAERNGVAYASYQELAGHTEVAKLIGKHVEAVNRALSEEPAMAGAQIKRFLILPKELDADDGELTRTQKVRRRFIADRYAPLVEGLYGGAGEAAISAEIIYEDGRKGRLEGRSRILEAPIFGPAPQRARAA
ncbi:MAG: AMP-binding protein [Pseudomonadota bacterium]|nr:AMP-binding protein [Pseudomonadota bacterium]